MKKDRSSQVAQFWNDIAHDFDAIYTGKKNRFARIADQWLRRDIFERFEWVMKQAGDLRGKTVCDIGCGSGRFAAALAKSGANQVTGVDVAPEMLKLAQGLCTSEGVIERCEFFQSDVLHWQTDRQFDVVIAIGFWDYIGYPPDRLRVIRKLTKEKFLSAWPRLWTWRMPLRKLRLTVEGCPVYFFRRRTVEHYLRSTGFEIVRFDKVGKLHCVEARPV